MAVERTLVFLKPDAVMRGLTGPILSRFEARGFTFVAMKLLHVSKDLAEKHYAIHKGKPFYDGLVKYVQSGPVVACVLEGEDAIAGCRRVMGATDPKKGAPGEIRFDYAQEIGRNLVHGSDGADTAKTEIALWFKPDELVSYRRAGHEWVHEKS
ncbi:MAG TPA: nucleoside-diphosphate kinase [Candidatus Thermoplasmatota archaeon]|nr:nucleoside-diphosphate kinase [Candidatus Thermoplasmatota archaeon]